MELKVLHTCGLNQTRLEENIIGIVYYLISGVSEVNYHRLIGIYEVDDLKLHRKNMWFAPTRSQIILLFRKSFEKANWCLREILKIP